jgi:hypothetical protein
MAGMKARKNRRFINESYSVITGNDNDQHQLNRNVIAIKPNEKCKNFCIRNYDVKRFTCRKQRDHAGIIA